MPFFLNGRWHDAEIVDAQDTGSPAASSRWIVRASGRESLSLGCPTVLEYFRRSDVAGLVWPLPDDLSDIDLERRLFPHQTGASARAIPQPDWSYVHAELRRKGVTLALLWERRLSPVMRQRHPAGERLFVDCAGHTVDVIRPETGKVRAAQIFVAALGASNLPYVEATWSQSLPDRISSHIRAFTFLGGVPAHVVPANLKAAVIKACFHDPAINRTFGDITIPLSCPRGLASRRTKRRSRARCCWPSAG